MDCFECGQETRVVDSRKRFGTVYRRRKCKACNYSFWTSEERADPEEVHELMRELWKERTDN